MKVHGRYGIDKEGVFLLLVVNIEPTPKVIEGIVGYDIM